MCLGSDMVGHEAHDALGICDGNAAAGILEPGAQPVALST
jgi:hypothetical protein